MNIIKYKFHKETIFFNLLFILMILTAVSLFSQERYVLVMPNGLRTVHNAEIINHTAYLPLSQISPVLFPGGQYDESKGEIKITGGTVKIIPLSFFVVFKGSDSVRAAQMTLPAILFNSLLYVPAETFFKALGTLGLYNIKVERNVIGVNNLNAKGKFEKPWLLSETNIKKNVPPDNNRISSSQIKRCNTIPVFSESFNNSVKNLRSGLLSIKSLMNYKSENVEKSIIPEVKTIEQDTQQKPPLKGMQNPVNKVYPPNLYVLPRNLIRKELDDRPNEKGQDSTENQLLNINRLYKHSENLLASNSLSDLVSPPQIIKIYTDLSGDTLKIHIVANNTISSYQAPECKGDNVILRIPDVINSVDNLPDDNGIENMKSEKIKDFQIYRIKLKEKPLAYTSSRVGPKEVVYSIIFSEKFNEKKQVINDKTDIKNVTNSLKSDEETSSETNSPGTEFENEKKKWALDVIVLDPGHGGFDPGAISVSGKKEKDLTLDIALKVRNLIEENMPDTKVVMTRVDDRFVELYRRGQIANQSKGKLFISIHMNSAPTKPNHANGFETYILRPGRNDDAVKVANLENSVIKLEKKKEQYSELSGEKLIIATMAQAAFVKFSELFAKILQDEVSKTTPLTDRGVNQAGFYVLVGSSMPNVLFETAFLSNRDDEKYVTSETGQNKIAKGIFNAIKRYAEEYQKICK